MSLLNTLRQRLGLPGTAADVSEGERWIVLDVESSGLDPSRDRLLAIAAVGVRWRGGRPSIEVADSFETLLGAASPGVSRVDKGNILVHGIGVGAQRRALAPAKALAAFERYAGDAPRLGFHVDFDRVLIERAMQEQRASLQASRADAPGNSLLAAPPRARWLDLEPLAALTHPQIRARALDDWLDHFGIECLQRHDAMADTLATAELLLRLWPALQREGAGGFEACRRLAASRRWLT